MVAVKADEENMFLPADDDDLEEFVMGNTLEQLLNFKVSQALSNVVKSFFIVFFCLELYT